MIYFQFTRICCNRVKEKMKQPLSKKWSSNIRWYYFSESSISRYWLRCLFHKYQISGLVLEKGKDIMNQTLYSKEYTDSIHSKGLYTQGFRNTGGPAKMYTKVCLLCIYVHFSEKSMHSFHWTSKEYLIFPKIFRTIASWVWRYNLKNTIHWCY